MSLVPADSRKKDLDAATVDFMTALLSSENALRYLEGRGIDGDVILKYRLGIVPTDCSLEWKPYVGMLAIPYLTPTGVVTIRFRRNPNKDEGPKYRSLPGDQARLYNVSVLLADSDVVGICEGEYDAITVSEFADIPSVGVPGASNFGDAFALLFRNAGKVLCIGDGDEAGRGFADSVAERLEAIPVTMPEGHDCNSFLLEYGPVALREYLES